MFAIRRVPRKAPSTFSVQTCDLCKRGLRGEVVFERCSYCHGHRIRAPPLLQRLFRNFAKGGKRHWRERGKKILNGGLLEGLPILNLLVLEDWLHGLWNLLFGRG